MDSLDREARGRKAYERARAEMNKDQHFHAIVIFLKILRFVEEGNEKPGDTPLAHLQIEIMMWLALSYATTGKRTLANKYLARFQRMYPDKIKPFHEFKISIEQGHRQFKDQTNEGKRSAQDIQRLTYSYRKAIDQMEALIQIEPVTPDQYFVLAVMHGGYGNKQIARTMLLTALKKGYNEWDQIFSKKELATVVDSEEFEALLLDSIDQLLKTIKFDEELG